jgi:hypothetical protein
MIQLRLILAAGIFALLALLGYLAYSNIKQIGYLEAETKYQQILQENVAQVNRKIDAVEALSVQLVAQERESSQLLAQDIASIVKNTRNKPLTSTTKEGVCVPAPTFSDTLSKINQRANQNTKDKVP